MIKPSNFFDIQVQLLNPFPLVAIILPYLIAFSQHINKGTYYIWIWAIEEYNVIETTCVKIKILILKHVHTILFLKKEF
jgi:hypothetical protein